MTDNDVPAVMWAAVFKGDKTLSVEEVPTPSPAPGEMLVRVAACGICQTDLHYTDHGTPTFKKPPITLGHEISGTVAALGDGVKGWSVGDRVIVPPVLTCGACYECRTGRENICARMTMLGNHRDGGFAEFVAVPAKDCTRLPESVPLADACIIADAVSTPFHAIVRRARVTPGETVAVIGCGGVGINAVQIAAALGARVLAVDVDDAKLAVARDLGAAWTLNPTGEEKPAKAVRALTGGGVDVAAEIVGKPETIKLGLDALKTGGRMLLVGFAGAPAELPAGRVMFREQSVLGSLGCRPVDYAAIVDMVASGKLSLDKVVTARFPLARVNDGFDALRAGKGLRSIVTT